MSQLPFPTEKNQKKIMAKVVKNQLCSHLTSKNLLSSHQFGFVPGRNTTTQLLVTVKKSMKSLDEGKATDVAYMDFRKAFDAVAHQKLLYKIEKYGENNPKHSYYIGNGTSRNESEKTELEKDLGVLVDPELNFESHIEQTVKKASSKKATILRNFTYRSKNVLVPLFKTLVRPILEYANVVWDSSFRSQINLLESVQRTYTRHIK